jgi:hypothetical protein
VFTCGFSISAQPWPCLRILETVLLSATTLKNGEQAPNLKRCSGSDPPWRAGCTRRPAVAACRSADLTMTALCQGPQCRRELRRPPLTSAAAVL